MFKDKKKSPGSDGLPIEFFSVFWLAIKCIFVEALQYSIEDKQLSSYQRGIISLFRQR